MSNTVTVQFYVMRKYGQGRVLHAVPPTVRGWGKALCGEKTKIKWVDGPPDSVVTCQGCRNKMGIKRVAG